MRRAPSPSSAMSRRRRSWSAARRPAPPQWELRSHREQEEAGRGRRSAWHALRRGAASAAEQAVCCRKPQRTRCRRLPRILRRRCGASRAVFSTRRNRALPTDRFSRCGGVAAFFERAPAAFAVARCGSSRRPRQNVPRRGRLAPPETVRAEQTAEPSHRLRFACPPAAGPRHDPSAKALLGIMSQRSTVSLYTSRQCRLVVSGWSSPATSAHCWQRGGARCVSLVGSPSAPSS